jgi:hypothetical protein
VKTFTDPNTGQNNPFNESRGCVDIFCCCFFLLFLAGMVVATGWSIQHGDI